MIEVISHVSSAHKIVLSLFLMQLKPGISEQDFEYPNLYSKIEHLDPKIQDKIREKWAKKPLHERHHEYEEIPNFRHFHDKQSEEDEKGEKEPYEIDDYKDYEEIEREKMKLLAKRSSDIIKPRGELTGDLLRHDLIPDFVYDVPFKVCTVEWLEGQFADLGNIIPYNVVDFPPYWLDWKGNTSAYYTFIMTGLDEPSRNTPTFREYQCWVLVNIPGRNFTLGETLVYYKVPKPKEGTGKHRYGIVVYRQTEKLHFAEKPIKNLHHDKRRVNFSNIDFAEKYRFGEPIAVNFFQTEWEAPTTVATKRPTTESLSNTTKTLKLNHSSNQTHSENTSELEQTTKSMNPGHTTKSPKLGHTAKLTISEHSTHSLKSTQATHIKNSTNTSHPTMHPALKGQTLKTGFGNFVNITGWFT